MENLLAREKSPYLLMHAHNPVNWRPWGDEAFAEARRLDRPVFASSGYSACHWCHVMAEESFEDDEVAQVLNDGFVCVKLDREERPDVDSFLMQAGQLMTGSGGWPLSVFLTPDGRPFYAGTYYPKHRRGGMMGFVELLDAIRDSWALNRDELVSTAERLVGAVKELQLASPGEMDGELIRRCFAELSRSFDSQYGGFGRAPKFPTPHVLMFLLRYHALEGDTGALRMARATLDNMHKGGMYDHIGGGFCRYSTDRRWLVPHFEKMLYDNALLALAYAEAFQLTREPRYALVAAATLDYALREMRGDEGGFFSAQDADSGGVEGAYYLLDKPEVLRELGEADGEALCDALNITSSGNFEGRSIPNRLHAAGGAELPDALSPSLSRLYDYRKRRIELRVDDKRLTAWNALMIAALAAASGILDRPDYLEAAQKALLFVDEYLTQPDGELFIRWRDGEAAGEGTLDDYAYLCWALISLYDATLDTTYMQRARSLMERLVARFGGEPDQGFWLSAVSGELAVRPKESSDNALPSGNSVAALALVRLSRFFEGDSALQEQAQSQLRFVAGAANQVPSGYAFGLAAGLVAIRPARELACATESEPDAGEFRRMLHGRFLPDVTALVIDPGHAERAPLWARDCAMLDGGTTYYLCQNSACGLPMRELQAVSEALDVRRG